MIRPARSTIPLWRTVAVVGFELEDERSCPPTIRSGDESEVLLRWVGRHGNGRQPRVEIECRGEARRARSRCQSAMGDRAALATLPWYVFHACNALLGSTRRSIRASAGSLPPVFSSSPPARQVKVLRRIRAHQAPSPRPRRAPHRPRKAPRRRAIPRRLRHLSKATRRPSRLIRLRDKAIRPLHNKGIPRPHKGIHLLRDKAIPRPVTARPTSPRLRRPRRNRITASNVRTFRSASIP